MGFAFRPSNYQAWIAVKDGDRDFTRRVKEKTGADLLASGSVRMAGTGNFKRKYAPEFPTVAIEELHPGRMMTKAQLEELGLVAPAPAKPAPPASPLRCSGDDWPRRLAWPDYERCLKEALVRDRKRTSADFTWCCIAVENEENQNQVSLRFPLPLEIATRFPHSHRPGACYV